MRIMFAVVVVVLVTAPTLHAGDQGKSGKHKDAKGKTAVTSDHEKTSTAVSVSVSWGTHDLDLVRRHYAPRYRSLPPGLQKKYARTGQLPPGWQKKMEPFPASLERECAVLPSGYHRGVFDGHAVIYNTRGVIIDVAVLF
jgi:hypothetical protein